ncbi:hypothetical protein [Xanthomonas vasicola]|uniref:hypothetical protein n=1 Tax=Xanthomonas vasicola TaxID=56459 RepID=UPI00139243A1|nr:hypothetical protein [Xanthomonas vasicola]MBV6743824.1 hypothetical protein [Xanthomonas vasicola pv. musacearum NCPPB 2251]MBV7278725.1 hypothetical protein [Xanthomonas vasicola pv. musacearum]MBV7291363.1 hypothetical protein [Xanthomonas vasicola pv. musacearum]
MTDLLVRTSVEEGDAHGCFLRAHKRCRAVCAGQSIECGGSEQGHECDSVKVQACLLRARTLPASFSLRKHFMQLFFGLSFGQSKENAVYAAAAMRCGE